MKLPRMTRLAIGVLTAVVLLGGSAAGVELIPIIPIPSVDWTVLGVSSGTITDELDPCLDGNLLAFQYGTRVRVYNLATAEYRTIPLAAGATEQFVPDVSGDYVVYAEKDSGGNWDIRRYSWTYNSTSEVVGTSATEWFPKIDGNWVLWEDLATGNVYSRNYDMGGHISRQELLASGNNYVWDVDNERLFAGSLSTNMLHMKRLRPVSGWYGVYSFADDISDVNVHGTRVAVEVIDGIMDYDVLVYDLQTDSVTNFATDDAIDEFDPSIFHNSVAYAVEGADQQIGYGFLGFTIMATPDFGTTETDYMPSLYGHRCAFGHIYSGDDDVAMGTSDTKLAARTYGTSRYATAAAISRSYFADADNVVLCNGANFPDALSAAPLAKALSAPLLLTTPDALPAETLTEIQRLTPTKIWVIGGSAVISDAVYNQLDATYDVERVWGADRYATSAAIALRLETVLGASEVWRGFFARGDSFADALAVGPIAAAANGPILLVRTDSVPASIADAVDDMDLTIGYVAGGTNAISTDTDSALRALIVANGGVGTITERWSGTDRYATAAAIVEKGLSNRWIDLDTVAFATGSNFPDALGGGAALGYYGSPLLLTSGTSLSVATSDFLEDHEYEVGRMDVLGGTSAVSADVYSAILALIK